MRRTALALTATTLLAAGAVAVPAADSASTRTVKVGDDFFAAKSLTVTRNTTVRWRWVGESAHNVTVDSGPRKFRSTTKRSGSFSRKLTRRGTYRIVCTIHFGMKQTIRVK